MSAEKSLPQRMREAADTIEEFYARDGVEQDRQSGPWRYHDLWAWNPVTLRKEADAIEAEEREKGRRVMRSSRSWRATCATWPRTSPSTPSMSGCAIAYRDYARNLIEKGWAQRYPA